MGRSQVFIGGKRLEQYEFINQNFQQNFKIKKNCLANF